MPNGVFAPTDWKLRRRGRRLLHAHAYATGLYGNPTHIGDNSTAIIRIATASLGAFAAARRTDRARARMAQGSGRVVQEAQFIGFNMVLTTDTEPG